jgi:hypothetical protein
MSSGIKSKGQDMRCFLLALHRPFCTKDTKALTSIIYVYINIIYYNARRAMSGSRYIRSDVTILC